MVIKKHRHYNMRLKKYRYILCASVLVYLYYFFGVSDYIYSRSFDENFDYPLNVDIKPLVQDILSGKKSEIDPINYYPYRFLSNSRECSTMNKIDLFIAVKSAMGNFGHRDAIRKTYGRSNIQGRSIKTLFFLGNEGFSKSDLQDRIKREMIEFKDIIQMDFRDSYFNNTIKTMMSFRWIFEHCSMADYYLFTDDDMYISVKNLLGYVDDLTYKLGNESKEEIGGKVFLAGYVFKSTPQRFRSSKWRVSLDEYPWSRWPTYVTAGAYVVSNKAMRLLYVGSLFVKHFRFDDIYLGIVAKKVGIEPIHSPHFYFYKKKYDVEGYRDVIASHGYSDHEELVRIWREQNGDIDVIDS